MTGTIAAFIASLLYFAGADDAYAYCADATMSECIVVVDGKDALTGEPVYLPSTAEVTL